MMHLPSLAMASLGLEYAVELAPLAVYLALGRVDILGDGLLLPERASSEGHDLSREGEHGIYHPAAEAVYDPAVVGLVAQAGGKYVVLAVSSPDGTVEEGVFRLGGESEMEALYHGIGYAAIAEIAQTHVASLVGVGHRLLEKAHGEIIHRQHALAGSLGTLLLGSELALLDLDIILARQPSQSLDITELFQLHQEIDGTAALAATETLAHTLWLGYIERRRPVVVKRTQADPVGTSAFEADKIAHDLDYIRGIEYAPHSGMADLIHSANLAKKTSPHNTRDIYKKSQPPDYGRLTCFGVTHTGFKPVTF